MEGAVAPIVIIRADGRSPVPGRADAADGNLAAVFLNERVEQILMRHARESEREQRIGIDGGIVRAVLFAEQLARVAHGSFRLQGLDGDIRRQSAVHGLVRIGVEHALSRTLRLRAHGEVVVARMVGIEVIRLIPCRRDRHGEVDSFGDSGRLCRIALPFLGVIQDGVIAAARIRGYGFGVKEFAVSDGEDARIRELDDELSRRRDDVDCECPVGRILGERDRNVVCGITRARIIVRGCEIRKHALYGIDVLRPFNLHAQLLTNAEIAAYAEGGDIGVALGGYGECAPGEFIEALDIDHSGELRADGDDACDHGHFALSRLRGRKVVVDARLCDVKVRYRIITDIVIALVVHSGRESGKRVRVEAEHPLPAFLRDRHSEHIAHVLCGLILPKSVEVEHRLVHPHGVGRGHRIAVSDIFGAVHREGKLAFCDLHHLIRRPIHADVIVGGGECDRHVVRACVQIHSAARADHRGDDTLPCESVKSFAGVLSDQPARDLIIVKSEFLYGIIPRHIAVVKRAGIEFGIEEEFHLAHIELHSGSCGEDVVLRMLKIAVDVEICALVVEQEVITSRIGDDALLVSSRPLVLRLIIRLIALRNGHLPAVEVVGIDRDGDILARILHRTVEGDVHHLPE